jgi:toxin YoeB
MGYIIRYSNYALKDAKKLEACGLHKKAKELLLIIKENPYKKSPT